MGRVIFVTIGKECGLTHCYELRPSPVGMTLRETKLSSGNKIKTMYFDEATDLHFSDGVRAKTAPKRKLAKVAPKTKDGTR